MIFLIILLSIIVLFFVFGELVSYISYKEHTPKICPKLTFDQFKAFYYSNPMNWKLEDYNVGYADKDYTSRYKDIYFTSYRQWKKYDDWLFNKKEHDEWNKTFKEMTDLVGFWQEDVTKNQQKILDDLKDKINEIKKF